MTSNIEELEAKLASLPKDQVSIERVDMLNDLARGVFYSDVSRAYSLAQEAETFSRDLNYAKGLGYSLICKSFVVEGTYKDSATALTYGQEALSNLIEVEDLEGQALALIALGNASVHLENFSEALDFFNRCIEIRRTLGDQDGEGKVITNIGTIHVHMQNYKDALDCYLQAVNIHDETGNLQAKAIALNNIADLYMDHLNDHAQALTLFNEALELYSQLNNQRNTILTLGNLAKLHKELGNNQQALDYCHQTLQLSEEIEDLFNRAYAFLTMGQIYKNLNDNKNRLEYLNQSLAISVELDHSALEMLACWELGELYSESDEWEKAIEYYKQGLKSGEKSKYKNIDHKIYKSLSNAYEKTERFPEALEYYKAHQRAQKEVDKEEADKTTKSLMFQFQVERSQKEAEIYRLENVELASALDDLQKANTAKESLIQQLNQKTELLKKRSREDGLTGLYNRRYFDQRLRNEFKLSLRHNRSLSMAMIDIDKFKQINDTLSHNIGDKVLGAVASSIRESCRTTDDAARFGGDEFVILFPETNAINAAIVCEKVLQAVNAYNWKEIHPDLDIHISIGVADNESLNSYEEMMYIADKNMYKAKEKGNQVFNIS